MIDTDRNTVESTLTDLRKNDKSRLVYDSYLLQEIEIRLLLDIRDILIAIKHEQNKT